MMINGCTTWLVFNSASGSNDADVQAELSAALASAGCRIDRTLFFPDDDAPGAQELRDSGVEMVAVFAGDGTVSAVVTKLFGWEGAILVLPGGTMNLLARRLHGEASQIEIVERLQGAAGRKVRPQIIGTGHGHALTGVLAGPGTAWNDVREAMREVAVPEMVSAVTEAIGESVGGAKVLCNRPSCGREEGYAAIMISPEAGGLEVRGYDAQRLSDYAAQTIALLLGDFRDGPNEVLGVYDQVELACREGEAMDLLIDGEPCRGDAAETFSLIRCGVDLLATVEADVDAG